ncbi:acetyltransferase component of pyruvate dehydrogenase complex [Leucobacter sp. Psy1]|uniref:pyruvate dehydrogenase complex dihydrolipoamide acetyltransferase n=1 Tax=Leucobacter sp. Psy1 TaxID=2875729 RepID=UPI001CD28D5D|nr:pyruvate dehydrogenase complex dihydrolipoamide acetyltransferase [Leucobacter sp. Psy1]UBH04531.1 acetyltransferase component of pyruvate dehydrogenase complex [Leucobacter sp. Psy1]
MATVVRMPALVTGSAEATIAGWLIAVGEEVTAGQALVEIETEKATVEYEAEGSGVLAGVLLQSGDAAQVGTPIAVLATDGQPAEEALSEAGIDAGTERSGVEPAEPDPGIAEEQPAVETPRSNTTRDESREPGATGESAPAGDGERRFASPLVRKLARERGLDLSAVRGSGPGGRIVRRDIEHLDSGPGQASAPTVQSAPAPIGRQPAAMSEESELGYTDVPHSGMRRAIARRLTESKSTVPHFYLVAHCRMDPLLELRKQINVSSEVRVSVNDFIVKAVAAALQEVPGANAIWTDDATRRFDSVDISVAVSVPDGLFTPVVRGVEQLSLGALSRQIRDFADRARSGKLKQHELEGGSFSVSNLGMYGTTEFSAILNPPQAGILAVGAAEQRPVVQEDGTLGIATVMTVTLSADHRVLDGALAAEWLAAFQKRIEQPLSLLI